MLILNSREREKGDNQQQARDGPAYKRRKFNRSIDSGSQNSKTDRYSDSRRKGSNQNRKNLPQVNVTLNPVIDLIENQVHTQVGYILTQFADRWSEIIKDQWMLDVVQEGLQLNFQVPPHMSGTRVMCTQNSEQIQCLVEKVESLLVKHAIERVPQGQEGLGFYSTFNIEFSTI